MSQSLFMLLLYNPVTCFLFLSDLIRKVLLEAKHRISRLEAFAGHPDSL